MFILLCPYVISYAKMKIEAMVARAVRGAMFPVILVTPLPTAFAILSLHLINQILIICISKYRYNNVNTYSAVEQ